jgi:hypothetical protein
LLKEVAMDFFAANPTSVMSSPGWEKVEESLPLMKELMEVVFIKKKRSAPADAEEERDYKQCAFLLFVESSMRKAWTSMALERCSSVA